MDRFAIVLCTRRASLGAAGLRFAMWSRWSHSAVIDFDKGFVYDSTLSHGGVKRWTIAEFFTMYPKREIRPVDVPEPAHEAASLWLEAQRGKRYDWTALVGFLVRRDWSEDDAWFCSEMSETFRSLFAAVAKFRAIGKRWAVRITPHHQDIVA